MIQLHVWGHNSSVPSEYDAGVEDALVKSQYSQKIISRVASEGT